ncbi:transposase [Paraburkholderia polaris]|uniref:transposase n=1 Tax=Paraburkholderia polaris TaxID=2728848 RepID=UPI0038B2A8CB
MLNECHRNLLALKSVIQIPLSDADWLRIKQLIPESEKPASGRPGRPRRNVREILDAILWIHQTGEKWHRLPSTFPPTQTCYVKYCAWRREGIVQLAIGILERTPSVATAHGSLTPRGSGRAALE